MLAGDPQQSGRVTPSNPAAAPTTLASQIAASNAANPRAAGASGSLFSYSGPPVGSQLPGSAASAAATLAPPAPSTAPTSDWTSDPIYQLALGQQELAIKNAQSAALTSQTQALIAYGDSNLAFAITGDQNVALAAAANKGSTLAQLINSNAQNVRGTNVAENQANLFYSSDRGYKLGLDQQTYLNNASGALSGVQGQLGSIGANLLAQQNSAYANESQAASEAYGRAVANPVGLPASTPAPGDSATPASGDSATASTATETTKPNADGTVVTADGTTLQTGTKGYSPGVVNPNDPAVADQLQKLNPSGQATLAYGVNPDGTPVPGTPVMPSLAEIVAAAAPAQPAPLHPASSAVAQPIVQPAVSPAKQQLAAAKTIVNGRRLAGGFVRVPQ